MLVSQATAYFYARVYIYVHARLYLCVHAHLYLCARAFIFVCTRVEFDSSFVNFLLAEINKSLV